MPSLQRCSRVRVVFHLPDHHKFVSPVIPLRLFLVTQPGLPFDKVLLLIPCQTLFLFVLIKLHIFQGTTVFIQS